MQDVKVTMQGGVVVGAMLVGDTDLEEVMENLILDRLNIAQLGLADALLDPRVDIEDFFD